MNIDLTPEALLTQLGYPVNEHTLAQMQKTIENTSGFEHFSKHLLSLQDTLAHFDGFIALSNSYDRFKIKCDEASRKEMIEAFEESAKRWAGKYKVILEKVAGKPTYYIIGQN